MYLGYPGWKGYGDFGQFSYPDGEKVFENINEPVEYDDNDELLEFTQYSNGNWGCLGQAAFFDEAGRERKYVSYSLKLFYTNFKICFKNNSTFIIDPDSWPQVDSIYDIMMLDQSKWKAIVVEKSFQELITMVQVKSFCQIQNKTHFLVELVLLKLQVVNLCVKIFPNVKILQKLSFNVKNIFKLY